MISPDNGSEDKVTFIHTDGTIEGYAASNYAWVFPTLYLK